MNSIKDIESGEFFAGRKIEGRDFLSKICVTPPYFALNKIYQVDDILITKLNPQQQRGSEASCMTIGEAGRHLAILGTCACSIKEESKNYYLVEKALLLNNMLKFYNEYSSNYLVMKSTFKEKRKVGAVGFLFDNDLNLVYNIDVSYNKLSTTLFKKFFSKHFIETEDLLYNPYLEYYNIQDESPVDNKYFQFILSDIPDRKCLGHFKNCPSIPTAYLAHNLIHKCSDKVMSLLKKRSFVVLSVDLDLYELIFPGTPKIVKVNFKIESNEVLFNLEIYQNSKLNSLINFTIITQ